MLGPFGKFFIMFLGKRFFSDKGVGKEGGAAWGGVKALFILM